LHAQPIRQYNRLSCSSNLFFPISPSFVRRLGIAAFSACTKFAYLSIPLHNAYSCSLSGGWLTTMHMSLFSNSNIEELAILLKNWIPTVVSSLPPSHSPLPQLPGPPTSLLWNQFSSLCPLKPPSFWKLSIMHAKHFIYWIHHFLSLT